MNEELDKKLEELDKLLEGQKESLVIVGGVALWIRGLIDRHTKDVDCLKNISDEVSLLEGVKEIMEELNINTRVFNSFVIYFGEWEKDIHPVKKYAHFKNLRVNTISEERLLVSRLWSDKKTGDIEKMITNFDFNKEKFENTMAEVYEYAQYVFLRPFKENQYLVKELYKNRGWDYELSNIKKLYKE